MPLQVYDVRLVTESPLVSVQRVTVQLEKSRYLPHRFDRNEEAYVI